MRHLCTTHARALVVLKDETPAEIGPLASFPTATYARRRLSVYLIPPKRECAAIWYTYEYFI